MRERRRANFNYTYSNRRLSTPAAVKHRIILSMSRESPQAAFEHARAAMARGDLLEVFACLDVNDLKRISENAVNLSLGAKIDDADDDVRRICREHSFPLDEILA